MRPSGARDEGLLLTHMVYAVPISTVTLAGPTSVSTGGSGTYSSSSPPPLPPAQKPFTEHAPSPHLNSGAHGLTT